MPHKEEQEPKKLVLCFDGTGNTFTGSNADTNVVKLLSKLDRNHPDQFHYYQTGIGTYDVNETTVNKGWFSGIRSSISQTIDEGFGTTFDAHVMAGYRFLMRYYMNGAKIYMFGFSRGAYTAKFLARMVNTVGLLCKGNEEMVPFAFRLYQSYLAGDIKDRMVDQDDCGADPAAEVEHSHETQIAWNEIKAFKQTFCRNETVVYGPDQRQEREIKIYFLGIWDCVNSVAVLEQKTPVPVPVTGTAQYVRHAVAVDERRVKFKPALLAQDINSNPDEDIKEVWFPGCHGDVGGGWPSAANNPLDNKRNMTFWQSIKNFWTSRKAKEPSKDINEDRFQMSDIPLAWMIRELELVGQLDMGSAVKWSKSVETFKRRLKERRTYALNAVMHDSLSFGTGTAFFKALLWRFMEYLPTITRWELNQDKWVNVRFPLNQGSFRDIPRNAELHESLLSRLQKPDYSPKNNHGGSLEPCLKHNGSVSKFESLGVQIAADDDFHQTFKFSQTG